MPHVLAREHRAATLSSTQVVLREAKRLHRAAISDFPSEALPVLRRLLAAGCVPQQTLPTLFRERAVVRRKHLLRTLALEAGHASWEAFSQALPNLDPQALLRSFQSERGTAQLKVWFASEAEAAVFASNHGGRTARVGRQAVVLPASEAGED